MTYNFLKTSDEETIATLLSQGYKMIQKDGDVATFLNDKTLRFDDKQCKVQYSNMLAI
mgnify:CR=1 FL=1